MTADYKSMYLRLANAANDAIDAIDESDPRRAQRLLKEALLAAEEIYVQTDDTQETE